MDADGSTVQSDYVVLAIGAVPDDFLIARSGLEVDGNARSHVCLGDELLQC